MARLPRMIIPGQPQHVIVRGNNCCEIFCCVADYRFYLDKLQAACKKHDCQVHGYVLMTNHVHLLITPFSETSLGKTLQMLGKRLIKRVLPLTIKTRIFFKIPGQQRFNFFNRIGIWQCLEYVSQIGVGL